MTEQELQDRETRILWAPHQMRSLSEGERELRIKLAGEKVIDMRNYFALIRFYRGG